MPEPHLKHRPILAGVEIAPGLVGRGSLAGLATKNSEKWRTLVLVPSRERLDCNSSGQRSHTMHTRKAWLRFWVIIIEDTTPAQDNPE